MIFYRIELTLDQDPFREEGDQKTVRSRSRELERFNRALNTLFEGGAVWCQLTTADLNLRPTIWGYVAYTPEQCVKGTICIEEDIKALRERLPIQAAITSLTAEEISAVVFRRELQQYEVYYNLREVLSKTFHLNFVRGTEHNGMEISERIVPGKVRNKKTVKEAMQRLLPDSSLAQEIDRIFENRHAKWFGVPVHYKITSKEAVVADEIIDLMVDTLYLNRRLLSRRVVRIDNIESKGWGREELLKDLFQCSQNVAVEIVLSGDVATQEEYASQYHQITDLLAELIKEGSGNTLIFFVENASHPGFAQQLLGKLDEELDIIEIQEGAGNARQAMGYFKRLLTSSNMADFYEEGETLFARGHFYTATEVRTRFSQWRKEALKEKVYSAYRESRTLHIDKALRKKGTAFAELERMVGLTEVKAIVGDIVAAYKVEKLRNKYYDPNEVTTRHMIFSGNPGTAKTTVARLLAEILKENGVVKTGSFLEVGRADLVGKYVGWTAQIVKEKFHQARGGILFIDEAYALVEDRAGLYGDEAINTIVQEMENKRGDVIVIFAGYPEKMEAFLQKNEGLRSRIAFHVHFPDYGPEELVGILEKILQDRQYVMTEEAKARARQIFQRVCRQEEYGNGRFVRNLFEQAVNRQATRISKLTGELDREELFQLQEADLDVNIVRQYEKEQKSAIGFAG